MTEDKTEDVIQQISALALAEIRLMVAGAHDAVERGFSTIKRSNGQRFRWIKYHTKGDKQS